MKKFVILLSLSVLASCAHHPDVRPGGDGVHRVVISTDDKEDGARNAINQANSYCGEFKKSAVIVSEEQKYVGDMDERDYQTGKKISKVAKVVGGTVWGLGGQKESNVGGIVGVTGAASDSALGKGYNVIMTFKCQ